jgi:hypothetical protein
LVVLPSGLIWKQVTKQWIRKYLIR